MFSIINIFHYVLLALCFYHNTAQNIKEGTVLISDSAISSDDSESRECIPLSECKNFLWLLENNRTEKVLHDLVARDCGFEGTSVLIWCPIEKKLKTLSLRPDLEDEERGGGIINSLLKSKTTCSGSLTITHYGYSDSEFNEFKRTRMAGNLYRNLKILNDRSVVKIETEGNCCWKIHSEIGFRGQVQIVQPGYNESPEIQPKSTKKVSC